jgi:hypothetical protein
MERSRGEDDSPRFDIEQRQDEDFAGAFDRQNPLREEVALPQRRSVLHEEFVHVPSPLFGPGS